MLFYMYKQHPIIGLNMNKITTFFFEISQQTHKIYEKIAITQIWHRAKFYLTCISGPWYLIMVPNMNKIHPAIMEECVRTDWQMDWTLSYIPWFHLGGVGNNKALHYECLSPARYYYSATRLVWLECPIKSVCKTKLIACGDSREAMDVLPHYLPVQVTETTSYMYL